MSSIQIWSNCLSTKPINSCLFVRHLDNNHKNEDNCDSGSNEVMTEDMAEDIESLLQSPENCVKLFQSNDESIECKLYLKTISGKTEEVMETKMKSFSLLCSAKVIEIHGNDSNEYLKTCFNQFVDQFDGLSMFRCDYVFTEPQNQLTITFKNFNELWIYGIVVNLMAVKTQPVMPSKDVSSFASIVNMFAMFANSANTSNSVSNSLIERMSKIKTSEECEQKVSFETKDKTIKSDSNSSEDKCLSESSVSNDCPMCGCVCHRNENCIEFKQYFDKKFSDFEQKIDNKLNLIENKLISAFTLCLNKN